jgi:DNA-binding MarR family transcriptional regulator
VDDSVTPAEVGLRYLSVAHQMRKAVDEHMTGSGLSLARTKVLQVLDRLGPLRQAELAAQLGYAARSVTQAVEGLDRDGLVRREPHPEDHRAKTVTLTPAGSAALAEGTAAGERILQLIFGSLGQKRLVTLSSLLGAVESGLTNAGFGRAYD